MTCSTLRAQPRRRAWAAGCALLLALSSARVAQAQTQAQAQASTAARFEEAVRALEDHRFAEALALLEQVVRERPTPSVYVNLGYAYRAVGRSREALVAFERYLQQPSRSATPQELADLGTIVVELRAALVTVELQLSPSSARVRVDGHDEPASNAPLRLDPGSHRLEVQAEGFVSQQRELTLAPGTTQRLSVSLVREASEGRLLVHPSLATARVLIDGTLAGRGRVERSVPAGPHTVVLEAPGFAREERVVRVERNGSTTLDVTLRALVAQRPAWVLPVAIVGAVLVAGGIATGVAFAAQPAQPFVYNGRPGVGQWLGNTSE